MDSPYGAGMDPAPYIALAYSLGALALIGFFAWTAFERRRLRVLLNAVRGSAEKRP